MKKICTQCNTIKSLDEFNQCKSRSDGKSSECKECHNKYYSEKDKINSMNYYYANKDNINKKRKIYRDAHKEEENKKARDRMANPEVKNRKKEADKRYREKNRQKLRDDARQKMIDNPEYAKERRISAKISNKKNKATRDKYKKTEKYRLSSINSTSKRRIKHKTQSDGTLPVRLDITGLTEDLLALLSGQKYKCNNCHIELTDKHLDHYIPISVGGIHSITNVQWLCPQCNMKKSDIIPSTPLIFHLH